MRKLVFAVLLLLCSSYALAVEPLDAFDARIEKELAALDAGAVPLWQQANAARNAQKHDDAAALYAQVYARVPAFVHALRRQGNEELAGGKRELATQHLEQAVAQDRSSSNLAALALAKIDTPSGRTLDAYQARQAFELAREAAALAPDDPFPVTVLAQTAVLVDDFGTLSETTEKLETIAPNDISTHLFRATAAAAAGDLDVARAAALRAQAAGYPAAATKDLLDNIDSTQPFYVRWWKPVAIALALWFGGFAVLLAAGAVLSRVAMRAAREVPTELSANATSLGSGVRRVYAAVLFLSSVFYYLSIPIVIALVLVVGGGLIYAAFAVGHIPVKLVLIALVIIGISIWSILKSLFIRPSKDDPGMKVDLAQQPRLRALLDEVAARIGTKAVDNVYLTPGTEVAVMERGKRSEKERCLILGIGGLDGLELRPLKAVLGHEYGHFLNRDTAGGAFALAVRNSLSVTAYGLATGGAAAWYNPAWLFVTGFNRVFLRISEGASRLQEVLADRWAVFAYGAHAFEAGLRHIVERGVRFDAHVDAALHDAVDRQVPISNLYTYTPSPRAKDLTADIEEALNRKTSAYDSHPTPAERFALVHALPHRAPEAEADDAAPAWSLFEDPLALQRAMTEQVRENVRVNLGVEIAT